MTIKSLHFSSLGENSSQMFNRIMGVIRKLHTTDSLESRGNNTLFTDLKKLPASHAR